MSYKKLTPVAVIASFDSEGNIKPLYFRIIFSCEYMIEYDNAVRTIELLYKTDKHKWFIINQG